MNQSVCVTIVTYNSREFIEACLHSVFRQNYHPLEVVVVDNASTDGTHEVLEPFEDRALVIYNQQNWGFAAAQNQAIQASSSDWALVLNPDVLLRDGFIERLVERAEIGPNIGTVCGRLLALGRDLTVPRTPLIDTAGIYFTPAMRHFDRGWRQTDRGRFQEPEYVFGASAAAALYRRDMIRDISTPYGFFDPDFFAYREDADVAWRAQLFGWRCLYVPDAVGYHVRTVGPVNRRTVPAAINMHSVKNRLLMRVKNLTGGLWRRFWLPTTLRDLIVIGGCLFWEPTSLPAFWRAAKCFPRALEQRRWIMSRRKVGDDELARWFSTQPAAEPVPAAELDLQPLAVWERAR